MADEHFATWLDTPPGQYVLEWEQSRLDLLVADIFGFHAVQIGLLPCDALRANRMPLRFRCGGPGPGDIGAEVICNPHHLPFAGSSIDLIVLPHVLEFDPNPHQILREVERVMVPEGHVIVLGFNPFSLWGLRRTLAGRNAYTPWRGRYLSVRRLRDWFTLLGFEMRSGSFGCYAPPFRQEKWLQRWRFMEAAGNRWWPMAGSVYVVEAIKRQHGMRLVMPKWRDRMARAKALALVPRNPLTHKADEP